MYKIRTVEPDSKTFLHHHLSYHLIHTNDTVPGRLLVPGTRYLVLVSYIPGHGPSTLDANKKHIYRYLSTVHAYQASCGHFAYQVPVNKQFHLGYNYIATGLINL